MNRDGFLRRVYAELEPADQARLVIEALAREDRSEADRIAATVPRSTWSGPVASYEAVWRDAEDIRLAAIVVAATAGRSLAIFDTALHVARFQAARMSDVASFEVFKAAEQGELPDDQIEAMLVQAHEAAMQESEGLLGKLEQWRTEALQELAAYWRAFDSYCRERLRLDPETVERAFLPPGLRRPVEIEGVEPTPDELAVALTTLGGPDLGSD